MKSEHVEARDHISVVMAARATVAEETSADSLVTIECYAADGSLIWKEETTKGPVP